MILFLSDNCIILLIFALLTHGLVFDMIDTLNTKVYNLNYHVGKLFRYLITLVSEIAILFTSSCLSFILTQSYIQVKQ